MLTLPVVPNIQQSSDNKCADNKYNLCLIECAVVKRGLEILNTVKETNTLLLKG